MIRVLLDTDHMSLHEREHLPLHVIPVVADTHRPEE